MRRPRARHLRAAALALTLAAAAGCARHTPSMPSPAAPGDAVAAARQLVVVTTPGWNATTGTLRRFTRGAATAAWTESAAPVQVVVGRTGLAWGAGVTAGHPGDPEKHEGDGKAPAGVFPLDTAFGFAPAADVPWIRLPYLALQPGSECVDDGASAHYNAVVDRSVVPVDWTSAERMREIEQYRIGVLVGYNTAPATRGRGSCIFLHIWKGPTSTTAGCTAFDAAELERLLRWLDPARRPMLVQLPADEYARLRDGWRLP